MAGPIPWSLTLTGKTETANQGTNFDPTSDWNAVGSYVSGNSAQAFAASNAYAHSGFTGSDTSNNQVAAFTYQFTVSGHDGGALDYIMSTFYSGELWGRADGSVIFLTFPPFIIPQSGHAHAEVAGDLSVTARSNLGTTFYNETLLSFADNVDKVTWWPDNGSPESKPMGVARGDVTRTLTLHPSDQITVSGHLWTDAHTANEGTAWANFGARDPVLEWRIDSVPDTSSSLVLLGLGLLALGGARRFLLKPAQSV